ncbi:MAG TPA: DNA polymerase III subunit alpha, partial [Balneolales bacterium]|nr:DNA polymerase III subunit alpha [Balneolales bacterium]
CKLGKKEVEYPHPSLEKVLKPTYGIMVYQEQIMQVAQIMAGYSLGEADLLRRAMGKKKVEVMEKQREIFISRAVEKDVDKETAEDIFEKMAYFAGYGFNKSHSAAYSVVAYQTAYFKANYPAEYMASVLTHNMNDIKKVSQFIEECQRIGVAVDPPNVNTGAGNFVVHNGRIQYGMEAIKGVGSNAVAHLVEERSENGLFTSIFDLTARVDLRTCNRKTIESLIEAGAFDSIYTNRAQLIESLDDAIQYGAKKQEEEKMNQISLFGGESGSASLEEPNLREHAPWSNMERLKKERELIGFYLSGHPLDKFEDDINLFCNQHLILEELDQKEERSKVNCAGIITSVKRLTDKKGRPFAFLTIEDKYGSVEIIAFSNTYDRYMNLLEVDNLIVVDGVTDSRSGSVKIIANSFDRVENLREKNQGKIRIRLRLNTNILTDNDLTQIARLFENHKGNTTVSFDVESAHIESDLRMNVRKFVVDPSDELLRSLRNIIGKEQVKLERREQEIRA